MVRFRAGLISGVWLLLVLMVVFGVVLNVPLVSGGGTIYIRADGSIDPPTAPIQRDGDIYTFTADIYDRIVVQRSSITIDGDRYILQGYQSGYGFSLSGISNVTIKRTYIKKFAMGIYINNSFAIVIANNSITSNYYGIELKESSESIIWGNDIATNEYDGIILYCSSYNIIFGNNLTKNKKGLSLWGAFGNNVYKNNITNNSVYGIGVPDIPVSPSGQNYFFENEIAKNGDGVYFSSLSSHNSLYQNNVIDNSEMGIDIEGGFNHTLSRNNIKNSGGVGVWISKSPNNIISENNITNSGSQGLSLTQSPNHTIFGNSIINNAYGIILFVDSPNNTIYGNNIVNNLYRGISVYSSGNKIYHNNFINTQQAYSTFENNVWDDSYPSGGNYWSDYTGVDEFSGPNQDQLGSDGIGDAAYFIEEYNVDRYPLMKTFVLPLEKHVRIFTRPYVPIAELTVTYKWIDNIDGEDFYVVSNIQICTRGFTGIINSFIRDGSGHTIWSDPSLIWPGKPYIKSYSFEGDPLTVRGSDEIGISLKGIDVITALVKGVKQAVDWLLDKLQPYLDVDDILELVGVETWEEYPIAFAKSSSTQFYPESIEEPEVPIDMPGMQLTYLASPGELRVYDLEGRVTGLVNGEIREEIPNSAYLNDTVMILSPSGSYHHEVSGTEYGSYRLTIASTIEEKSNVFTAVDIPISPNAVHQYAIDWDALSVGGEGVKVQIDSDGDGMFEQTFSADNELTHDEFMFPKAAIFKFNPSWEGVNYPVIVSTSNSTLTSFIFNQPLVQISFKVVGKTDTAGYCNVTIPKSFLRGEPWTIKINGTDWDFTTSDNATHSSVYFAYTHASTLQVTVQGTWVVPEFPLSLILPIFMTITLIAAISFKRKHPSLQKFI